MIVGPLQDGVLSLIILNVINGEHIVLIVQVRKIILRLGLLQEQDLIMNLKKILLRV